MLRAQLKSAGGDVSGRHVRAPWSLPVFAAFATLAFVTVMIVPSYANSPVYASVAPAKAPEAQALAVGGDYTHAASRDVFEVSQIVVKPATPSAPAAGTPDPGSAQAIAYEMVLARGWGDDEYSCLVALWNRESHWNAYAYNASSGAYGIPQALPGEKMASAGADWATNPATQIIWGLGYIQGRYGTPCGAWGHSEDVGWY